MIKIQVGENSLTVSGHAGAGEKGADVVCAAVSVLVTGAAEFWRDEEGVEVIREGAGEDICFKFKFSVFLKKDDVEYIRIFLIECLRMVAERHPEHVSMALF